MYFLRSLFTENIYKINEINEKNPHNKQKSDIYVQETYKNCLCNRKDILIVELATVGIAQF